MNFIKTHKKGVIITAAVVIVVVAGVVIASKINKVSRVAEVVPVSMINSGNMGDALTSWGIITNDQSQNVNILEGMIIEEVLVTEGQEVKKGDVLVTLNTEQANLSIKAKELEVQQKKIQLDHEKAVLGTIGGKNVVPDSYFDYADIYNSITDYYTTPQGDEKTEDAYNYLDLGATPMTGTSGDGSYATPYVYLITPGAYMTADFMNNLLLNDDSHRCIQFVYTDDNKETGALTGGKIVNFVANETASAGTFYSCEDGGQIWLEVPKDYIDTSDKIPASEVEAQKKEQLKKIQEADLDYRKEQLELLKLHSSMNDGNIVATVDGVVKKVGDKERPTEGGAFIKISASNDLYVQGTISELYLDSVKVGQEVEGSTYNTGAMFTAKITEIDNFPQDEGAYFSDGAASSNYNYIAVLDSAEGLENGEEASISINVDGDLSEKITLEKMYIRSDDKGSYVFKKGKNNRLKKQYVTLGKSYYGYCTEILEGVAVDDCIAFPYGKTAVDGAKCKEVDWFTQ